MMSYLLDLPKEKERIGKIPEPVRETHIYQREIVAQHYDRSFIRDFPLPVFEETVFRLLDYCTAGQTGALKIFEGGIGTGLFTIPVIDYLFRRDAESCFIGVDNSAPMLQVLHQKPEISTHLKSNPDRISIFNKDLEQPLDLPCADFDAMILAGVFHCLNDPLGCLVQLDPVLKPGGHLVMVFKTDDFTRMQSGVGYTNSNSDSRYGKFWRRYHELRDALNVKIDPKCRLIYDVYHVHTLLRELLKAKYEFQKTEQVNWKSHASIPKMIFSIEHGLTFATGQGVEPALLQQLGGEMTKWAVTQEALNKDVLIEHKMEMVVWRKKT